MARVFVEVRRADGSFLGNVIEGDTVIIALNRLRTEPGGLLDKDNVGLLDSETVNKAGGPYVFKPQETDVLQRVLAERDSERAKRQKLEQDVIIARLEALNSKTTTEKALSATEDVLNKAFDEAEVVDFWLPELANRGQVWNGPWTRYENTDPSKTESDSIQPAFDDHFQARFPQASAFKFVDTHSGWNGLTHDATLFLRDGPNVELRIAAIFEWVGQNEKGWPSKAHKAKFLRDCLRVYLRCGKNRQVHGVITDLSRLVAVKVVGCTAAGVPVVKKTATLSGAAVCNVLTRFAFASPDDLSVQNAKFIFPDPDGRTASRPRQRSVIAGRILGKGLHGSVFSTVDNQSFIKSFVSPKECGQEVASLRALNAASVPHMVTLVDVSFDQKSFIGSPVGIHAGHYQGQTYIWHLGVQLVDCLRQIHAAGLCHRDVRPENIVVVEGRNACLIDFASASTANEATPFVGTTHYAPRSVLETLGNVEENTTPTPAHDLESLVYTIYDLSRPMEKRPEAVSISEADFYLRVGTIKDKWIEEAASSTLLFELLDLARRSDYDGLKASFEKK